MGIDYNDYASAFVHMSNELIGIQKNNEQQKVNYETNNLQGKIDKIIGSLGLFGVNAKHLNDEFRWAVMRSVEQLVLSNFYHELLNLNQIEGFKIQEKDIFSRDETKKLEITIYNISDSLQIREWERTGFFAGVYHNLDMVNSQGKLIERIQSNTGKIERWERFHYDEAGIIDSYVNINYSESMPEVNVLKFKQGQFEEAKKISFYDDDSGASVMLTKKTEQNDTSAIINYSNSKVSSIEYGVELIAEIPNRGDIALISSVGLNTSNPSEENGFFGNSKGSWIGIKYCNTYWSNSIKNKAADGRIIWDKMLFGYDNPLILSNNEDGMVELEISDGAKAQFPLEVNLKTIQQDIVKEALYE